MVSISARFTYDGGHFSDRYEFNDSKVTRATQSQLACAMGLSGETVRGASAYMALYRLLTPGGEGGEGGRPEAVHAPASLREMLARVEQLEKSEAVAAAEEAAEAAGGDGDAIGGATGAGGADACSPCAEVPVGGGSGASCAPAETDAATGAASPARVRSGERGLSIRKVASGTQLSGGGT